MLRLFRKSFKTGKVTIKYPLAQEEVTANLRGKTVVDSNSCDSCGLCKDECPTQAIEVTGQAVTIAHDKCLFCGTCTDSCPKGAINHTTEFELAHLTKLLSEKTRKILGRSLHIRHVDTGSCNGCDFEMNALTNPIYDIQSYGIDFVASPRHADMLLVTGSVTEHLETALKKTYAATPEPKLVAAMGACACSGGIFKESYAVLGGVDKVIPVDLYIPGCPPRPQAIIYGLLKIIERLK